MRNKFAGDCYKCGCTVDPGTGHFERIKGGGWRVQHALHPGRGAVTCDMACAKDLENEHKRQIAETRQCGCVMS